MMLDLNTDPASVMCAFGLLRSYMVSDDLHINAVMEAVREDPDPQALMRTFSAMFAIAVVATASLALANVFGDDEEQVLAALQRQLTAGDVPPPDARPEATP